MLWSSGRDLDRVAAPSMAVEAVRLDSVCCWNDADSEPKGGTLSRLLTQMSEGKVIPFVSGEESATLVK